MRTENGWNRLLVMVGAAILSVLVCFSSFGAAKKMTRQEVLDRVKKTFDGLTGFRADLAEIFRWQLAETTTETRGWMAYRKDDRFRLEFPNQRLIVDGKTLWRYNSESNQLLIERYSDDSGVILPKQLMAGLSTHWDLQNGAETCAVDSVGYLLDLLPKEQESAFRCVTVWIDADNWLVRKALVDDMQGNRTEYRIDQIAVNPVLPDSLFKVKVPKETETIDLR